MKKVCLKRKMGILIIITAHVVFFALGVYIPNLFVVFFGILIGMDAILIFVIWSQKLAKKEIKHLQAENQKDIEEIKQFTEEIMKLRTEIKNRK